MYYFVEWMRAKRSLRVAGIILAVLIACGIGFRLWFLHGSSPHEFAYGIEHSPTAHVTSKQLGDGTASTTVDDPAKRLHAVINRKGNTLHLTLSEPIASYRSQSANMVAMGNENENADERGGMIHVKIDYSDDMDFDLSILFLATVPMGLLVGTMLAAPLAKENDGHLELTWTKPVSREQYATASVAVDLATIVISQLMAVVAVLLCVILWKLPSIGFSSLAYFALAFIAPISWYALLTAIGASVKRGPGMVIGMGWLGAIIVGSVAAATHGAHAQPWIAIHDVFQAVAYIDPISYLSFGDGGWHANGVVTTIGEALVVLFFLAVLSIVSAVLQWRRVEA